MRVHAVVAAGLGPVVVALSLLVGLASPAVADPIPPYLELVETVPDAAYDRWKSVADGHISMEYYGVTSEHSWTAMPAVIDGNGFDITLTAQGSSPPGKGDVTIGTAISITNGFAYNTSPNRGPFFTIPDGQSGSQPMTIHITPSPSLAPGSIAEIWVGASYGPGVYYRYRVSATPLTAPPNDDDPKMKPAKAKLVATLDCPGTIVISALPSLNCHINISGFQRNTATPVEVIFPDQKDTFGNHENGIQLDGDGENDVFNWDQSYSWGIFVFACPGRQSTGANCYGSETEPGMQSTRIIVRQGAAELPLTLLINAVANGGEPNASQGVVRFGNVMEVGNFLNLEEGGSLKDRPVRADWLSAQWEMIPVGDSGFVRLRNLWRPEAYLHMENGTLEAGTISDDWLSAQWAIEPVVGTPYVHIRNRGREDQFINSRAGQMQVGPVFETMELGMWWMLP